MKARVEKDTFGPIEVPEDHLWGAQTQRSLQFFAISTLVHAMARLKRVAALPGWCAPYDLRPGQRLCCYV